MVSLSPWHLAYVTFTSLCGASVLNTELPSDHLCDCDLQCLKFVMSEAGCTSFDGLTCSCSCMSKLFWSQHYLLSYLSLKKKKTPLNPLPPPF